MRQLTPELLAQLYGQTSNDPFLMLVTIDYNGTYLRFVNDIQDITSNGEVYQAFPMRITLPAEDGETDRTVKIVFDNVSLELIDEIRTATTPLPVQIDMILASNPDLVQISVTDLKIKNVQVDAQSIQASLFLDDVLNIEVPSEKYTPTTAPGIFLP